MLNIYQRLLFIRTGTTRVQEGNQFREIEVIMDQLKKEPSEIIALSQEPLKEMLKLRSGWGEENKKTYKFIYDDLKEKLKPYYAN